MILIAGTAPVALLLALAGVPWLLACAVPLMAVVAIAADAVRTPSALSLTPRPPAVLYIGEAETLPVTVSAPNAIAPITVELLLDVSPTLEPPTLVAVDVIPNEVREAAILLLPRRRGPAAVTRLWARWRGPLGLAEHRRTQRLDLALPVIPNIRAVREAALRFAIRDAYFGSSPQRDRGDGTAFRALREYVPGLDPRSIDWKHSARHHALVCKEFEAERDHQIVLAFDTGHLMAEPLNGVARLDHGINAALLLAYAGLKAGDRIGLFAFDSAVRHSLSPVSGPSGFAQIQEAAAALEEVAEETNFTLGLAHLRERLNRRSLIVLFSEFVDTVTAELMVENVGRLTGRHLVLFVTYQDPGLTARTEAAPNNLEAMTRAVVADTFARERRRVLERLTRLGVQCVEAPVNALGASLINRYLAIKRMELI